MSGENVNMAIIDVSEVISIYLLFEPEESIKESDLQSIANGVGSIAESYGKQIEDVTVGVMESENGPLVEGQVIFSTKEINTIVLGEIVEDINGVDGVGNLMESTATSNVNETKGRVRKKYNFVG